MQQYEIFGLLLKNAFGSSDTGNSSDIINNKIKSLPVLNDARSVQNFFQRQNNG